jgi:hypothetical protein
MKVALSLISLAALVAVAAADPNLALGKTVTSSGYYNSGSEVFPAQTITDGRYNDTGTGFDWSFWLTPQNLNGYATVDLGAIYSVSSFVLQDTHNRGYFDRGTNAYTIALSNDGVNFTDVVSDSFSNSEWSTLALKTNTLGVSALGRYVRFTVDSRYGASAGLNEIEVYGQPVPEPATMAALGLGAVGVLRRRRKA